MIKPKKWEKSGENRGNIRETHGNIGNIICHFEKEIVYIFWIGFVSQNMSYYIGMVKPETGKKPVKKR